MNRTSNPSARAAAVLFALAGAAFLVSAYLNREASRLVWVMQVAAALIFFVAGYRWYAHSRAP